MTFQVNAQALSQKKKNAIISNLLVKESYHNVLREDKKG